MQFHFIDIAFIFLFLIIGAMPHGMQDFSSLTEYQTHGSANKDSFEHMGTHFSAKRSRTNSGILGTGIGQSDKRMLHNASSLPAPWT